MGARVPAGHPGVRTRTGRGSTSTSPRPARTTGSLGARPSESARSRAFPESCHSIRRDRIPGRPAGAPNPGVPEPGSPRNPDEGVTSWIRSRCVQPPFMVKGSRVVRPMVPRSARRRRRTGQWSPGYGWAATPRRWLEPPAGCGCGPADGRARLHWSRARHLLVAGFGAPEATGHHGERLSPDSGDLRRRDTSAGNAGSTVAPRWPWIRIAY
jgi:hypothetical protein